MYVSVCIYVKLCKVLSALGRSGQMSCVSQLEKVDKSGLANARKNAQAPS